MTITINPKDKKESEKIKAILKAIEVDFMEETDWWNELSDSEKNSIEMGLKDVEEGRVISHEEVMKSFGR